MRLPIRWKLLILVIGPITAVYVGVLGLAVVRLEQRARENAAEHMTDRAGRFVAAFDGRLRELAQIARSTASFLETHPEASAEQLYAQLRANVAANPLCYGAAIAFEPRQFEPSRELFCPYVFRGGHGLASMDIAAEAYDYTSGQWEWWTKPRTTNTAVWTSPYFDEGAGDILMSTYAVPVSRDGEMWAVTTVDIALEPLREAIVESIGQNVDFFIITALGQYVYHPNPQRIMNVSIIERAEAHARGDILYMARRMTSP